MVVQQKANREMCGNFHRIINRLALRRNNQYLAPKNSISFVYQKCNPIVYFMCEIVLADPNINFLLL